MTESDVETSKKARVAVVGAGWWSQGWHLPHLAENEDTVVIAAVVDLSPHPKSNLNPNLESLETLGTKYKTCVYATVQEMLQEQRQNDDAALDGVIIATPHATHYEIAKIFLEESMKRTQQGLKPINILLEKPMTTDVKEAYDLMNLVQEYTKTEGSGTFLINHSANYREQAKKAREVVESGRIGSVRHVSAFFASPLSWLFDDPANRGWNEPTGPTMVGNGFAWGQSSHLLGWIYHVCGPQLQPQRVYCAMTHSGTSGADVAHAATIHCRHGAVMSVSGTSLLPGDAHSEPPVGKHIQIRIFGDRGALVYGGDDRMPTSGSLELRLFETNGLVETPHDDDDDDDDNKQQQQQQEQGFLFENVDVEGAGPESLQEFLRACRRNRNDGNDDDDDVYVGADAEVGFRTVQTIDAMYRSHASKECVEVGYMSS